MKLKEVGERALLRMVRGICDKGPQIELGIGDDAAAINIGDKYLVVSTDMLIGNVHFLPETPIERIGRKSVVVNLSDLAAMGANPLGLVFSIGAPRDIEYSFIKDLLESMNSIAREYDTYIVGGDLNESTEIIISGTAFGTTLKNQLLTRSGAREGDIICLTGDLGSAAAGLKIILDKLPRGENEGLLDAFHEPVARVKIGHLLAQSGVVTSTIDISDGLAANLWQISRMSEVKLIIDKEELPINPQVKKISDENNWNLDELTLFSGEDFELLFTVKREGWESLKENVNTGEVNITKIGEVSKGHGVYIKKNSRIEELPDRGYEHFR